MPCDRILNCDEKSYKSWFDRFCRGSYKTCYIWKRHNRDRLTPKEWMKQLNLKAVDEMFQAVDDYHERK